MILDWLQCHLVGVSLLLLMALSVLPCCQAEESLSIKDSPATIQQVTTGSQRVPAGTKLTIVFETPLDATTSSDGDPFIARLAQDFYSGKALILPKSTVLRGRVLSAKRPGLFSRGGSLDLSFQHVMLPSGELLPLMLSLSADNSQTKVFKTKAGQGATNPSNATVQASPASQQRVLYADPGVGAKVSLGTKQAGDAFNRIVQGGLSTGRNTAGGLGSIVTVPASVLGGSVVAAGLTTGKTAVALVGKGQTVTITPGDTLTIDFGDAFALPVQQ
jgi:hypothetical protein